MLSRLIVWRHGQTAWNAARRIQGQSDIELDAGGVAQARAAARVLAAAAPALIVSSDLRRARQTAAALADVVSLPVEIDPRLRERRYGEWEGLTAAEIALRYPEQDREWRREGRVEVPGVEPLPDLGARVAAALREWAGAARGTVVAVTHGSAGRHGCRELLGLPLELAHVLGGLANCRWTELRRAPRGWQLIEHNVGAPLDPGEGVPAAAQ